MTISPYQKKGRKQLKSENVFTLLANDDLSSLLVDADFVTFASQQRVPNELLS